MRFLHALLFAVPLAAHHAQTRSSATTIESATEFTLEASVPYPSLVLESELKVD